MRYWILLAIALSNVPSLAQKDSAACPCCAEEFRQFDFWIGDWVVKDSAGAILGYNRIERIQEGCSLQENWTSAKGNTGTSLSFYKRRQEEWHQSWIDQNGGVILMDGQFQDGKMVLLTAKRDNPDNGKYFLNRTSWQPLPDGRVKHVWEFTKDGEETWAVVFEGYYSKRESK